MEAMHIFFFNFNDFTKMWLLGHWKQFKMYKIQTFYCKLGNLREGFIFAKLCIMKFRDIKILEKWQNHSVVY